MDQTTWISWYDLTGDEKEQATETYQLLRETEEETPCSRERAEDEVPFCRFERMADGYIYVDL